MTCVTSATAGGFRWDLLGFGVAHTWVTGYLASCGELYWDSVDGGLSQVAVYVAATLAAFGWAVLSRRHDEEILCAGPRRRLCTCAALLLGGILAGELYQLGVSGQTAALVMGSILVGLVGSSLEVLWVLKFLRLDNHDIQMYLLFVMAFSSLLSIGAGAMPQVMVIVFSPAALAIAVLLLFVPTRGGRAQKTRIDDVAEGRSEGRVPSVATSRCSRKALRNLLIAYLVYSTVYNMFVSIVYAQVPASIASQARFWANFIAAVILLATFMVIHQVSVKGLFRFVLPITVAGFVLYLTSPAVLGEAALMVAGVGRKLFDIMTLTLVVRAVCIFDLPSLEHRGLIEVAKNLGYCVGFMVAMVMFDAVNAGVLHLGTLLPALILVLIVVFFWVFPEGRLDDLFDVLPEERPELGEAAREDDRANLRDRVDAVARAHALTPREREVAYYLACGRSAKVIVERLGISRSTVHAHTAHVYSKLGVHTQQELIDLVEGCDCTVNMDVDDGADDESEMPSHPAARGRDRGKWTEPPEHEMEQSAIDRDCLHT